VGQPPGVVRSRALRSRERWLELAQRAGIWVDPCGSLHLAYHPDEWTILQEFANRGPALGYDCRALTAAETTSLSPAVNPDGLLGALSSPMELCVDPGQAIVRIPQWLREEYGVETHFGVTICAIDMPHVRAADGRTWRVDRAVVCGGADFQTLFPELFRDSGIRRCKLQMMRTKAQPAGWRIGPMLAGGLTLLHYPNFEVCSSLTSLRRRIQQDMPAYVRFGIHVMISQNLRGEVLIGDSHEYDGAIEPFDKAEIDDLILMYLRGMARLPETTIAARWHGIYAKHPHKPAVVLQPQPNCFVVAAPGGTGMTVSFGTAEDLWNEWDGATFKDDG
jgi:FAD dependent oxidoreductase TIGR03364